MLRVTLSVHHTHEQGVRSRFNDGNAIRNLSNSESNRFSSASEASGYQKKSAASMPPAASRKGIAMTEAMSMDVPFLTQVKPTFEKNSITSVGGNK